MNKKFVYQVGNNKKVVKSHSQISELCYTLKGFIYLYVVILSFILLMKHKNIKFWQISLLATNLVSVFFFIVCMLSPSKLTASATIGSCVPPSLT